MKKLLLIASLSISVLLALIYTLLFTSFGNNIVRPFIQNKINASSPLHVNLKTFTLRPSTLNLVFELDDKNAISVEGNYALFAQNFDLNYTIALTDLQVFRKLSGKNLSGKFLSDGKVTGSLDNFQIKGKSNFAQSNTDYAIVSKQMQIQKAAVKLSHLNLRSLLSILGEEAYATGNLDLHIQLNDLDPKHLQGSVQLNINKANLNTQLIHKEFGLKIDKTSIKGELKAKLEDTRITYLAKLDSALAYLHSKGKLETDTNRVHSTYNLDIKELGLLKSLISFPLRGPFSTRGDINGNKAELTIKGTSDLAHSATQYHLVLKEFNLDTVELDVNNARLEKLLYLVGEKPYAQGKLDLTARLSSLSPLKGDTRLDISKATLNTAEIKKAFDIKLPYTRVEFHSIAKLNKDKVLIQSKLDSNLALLTTKETQYTLNDSSIKSDFNIFFPDLKRLETVIDKKLYGDLRAHGDITKNKKLTINAHSNIFDGTLDANIIDDDVKLKFKDLHALKVLHMLGYPKVMDAPVNGTLVYNTKTKKGKLDSSFDKAILVRSKMTDLIKGLTRTDLVKERFSQGSLISLINNDVIRSELKMKSKAVNLASEHFIINSKKRLIDARFSLQVKKYHADVLVTQSIDAPKVRLDAKSMITPEIKEKVGKEINRFLKKLF